MNESLVLGLHDTQLSNIRHIDTVCVAPSGFLRRLRLAWGEDP